MGQKKELAEYRHRMYDLTTIIESIKLTETELSECIDIVDSALKEMT